MMGLKNEKNSSRPPQISLILRVAAGGYLVYIAYSLLQEIKDHSGQRMLLLIFCAILFFAVGAAVAGLSALKLIRREYLGADGADPDETEDASKTDEEK